MNTRDLLIEIGTEELPPKALRRMRDALQGTLLGLLDENNLAHGQSEAYATPRRLALLVRDVPESQPDRDITRRGPALKAAFDDAGKPTRPAEGFARSCGVAVSDLEELHTDKGSWLVFHSRETGQATTDIVPGLLEKTLKQLPMPKRMRWGNSDIEFVRPLHWMLILFGEEPVKATILGVTSGAHSRGHRFHHNEAIQVTSASAYVETLEHDGMVEVDMDKRRESIRTQVSEAGTALGGNSLIDDDLLDDVVGPVDLEDEAPGREAGIEQVDAAGPAAVDRGAGREGAVHEHVEAHAQRPGLPQHRKGDGQGRGEECKNHL